MDGFKKRKLEEATNNNNDEFTTDSFEEEEEMLHSLFDPLAKTRLVDLLSKLDLGSVQQQQSPWQAGITILPKDIVNNQEQEDERLQQQQMISYRQETPSCNKTIMQQIGSYDRSYMIRCGNPSERDKFRELKRKLIDEFDVSGSTATPPSGQVLVNDTNPGIVVPRKTRIIWTQDLHDRFIQCLTCLGGVEMATPKAILRLMDSQGLTIFHVKSHLQKYRVAKYLHETAKGNLERTSIDTIWQDENTTAMQFKDALQMELFVQRQLHEQLEIERSLQLRIEEQAKQLKMMFDNHRKQNANNSRN